jgi:SAM-dependent methyltransferase
MALEVGARAHFEDAAYYAKTYASRTEDVEFYSRLAANTAVLEYGIGSGRIAIPMARAGAAVVGIDWSQPMLDDLSARLWREPVDVRKRVRAVHGDMRDTKLRRQFPLVVCTFNTFLHLYVRDDFERFFARVKAHLAPGGRFVFDASIPHPGDLGRDPNRAYPAPRLRHPTTGQLVKYAERFDYDWTRQILFVTIEFTPVDGGEPWVVPLAHRQIFPEEMRALLHYNGFVVDRVDGNFEGDPMTRWSDMGVWHCRVA